MFDAEQRKIEYLRLSVTDRCNLRCSYCMPSDDGFIKSKNELLNFDEIIHLISLFAKLGIKRVRITGGEPLVRRGLPELVGKLWEVQGIEEVLMTTNGILLERFAPALFQAGLRKINIHLDTLDPQKFRQITRWGNHSQVLQGLKKVKEVGFEKIKLNMVIQQGINDDEIIPMMKFARNMGVLLRLIELMPIGVARTTHDQFYLSLTKVFEQIQKYYTLIPTLTKHGFGPARYYQVKELGSEIGFITPLSNPFCDQCNRVRLASDGMLQDCLAVEGNVSSRDYLRDPNMNDERLMEHLAATIRVKPAWHMNFSQEAKQCTPCMYGIGG